MLNIYKASAGSGKTYQLAKEYIRSLIGIKDKWSASPAKYRLNLPKYSAGLGETSNRHRHILAITFTNKATEEMKKRIIDELDALSKIPVMVDGKLKDANYAKDFCHDFGCTRQELAEASKKALVQLLNDYSSFSVTTIDAFFQRVLRTFARELDRQGDYAVELDDKTTVQTSVGLMLDEYNRDPDANHTLGKWIYTYMLRRIRNGDKSNFFNRKSHLHTTLVKLVSKISEEQFKKHWLSMFEYLADDVKINAFRHQIRDRQKLLTEKLQLESADYAERLKQLGLTTAQIKNNYQKLKVCLDEWLIGGNVTELKYLKDPTVTKIIEGNSSPYYKKANAGPEGLGLLSDMFQNARTIYNEIDILDDIYDSTEQLALLGHVWKHLLQFTNDNNIILLSDTNHLLERIIGGEDTPFIYERLGAQYSNFLIDEFQDTSRMQWSNLKPLVANGLDSGDDSLIIGDEKQSIYRFRNSDSSLLHTQVADHDFTHEQYGTEVQGDKPGQNTNYRSASEVVRFNNTLFQHLAALEQVEGFENVVQDIAPQKADVKGYVRITPTRLTEEAADTSLPYALDALTESMLRQHSEGQYAWSDIAILVKTNDEGAQIINHIINRHPEIPVISDESLYLRKSQAVQLVLSVLKVLANEQPRTAADAAAVQPEKRRFPTSAEVAIAISRFRYFFDRNMSADQAIGCAIDPDKAPEHLSIDSQIDAIKGRKPSSLPALIETIIHELLTDQERTSQISFLNAFQDYVIDFCKYNHPTITALLKDWDKKQKDLSVASASNIDAVRVMTIHKSKGLEFDCVHIPYGSWALEGSARGQWIELAEVLPFASDVTPPVIYMSLGNAKYSEPGSYFVDLYAKDRHESRVDTMNLTYVAYTRAGRELTIYTQPDKGITADISRAIAASGATDDPRLIDLSSYYDPETHSLTIGEPTTHIAENKHAVAETMTVTGYNVYFNESTEVITSIDDIFETDTDPAPAATDDHSTVIDQEARQWGILLHDILAKVRDINDVDDAISRININRRIPAEQRKKAKKVLTEMLDAGNEYIHRWFVEYDQVLNEQSILLPDDYTSPVELRHAKEHDYRRPDRLVFHDGGVDVIDYKFTANVSDEHIKQVKEYMYILQKMGYSRVNGFLWYPMNHGIIPVK